MFPAHGGEKEAFWNAPEYSISFNKAWPQEKLFYQSLTYWEYIGAWKMGSTQIQRTLDFHVEEGKYTPFFPTEGRKKIWEALVKFTVQGQACQKTNLS